MKFKAGVKINGIKPELTLGIIVAEGVYKNHGQELVVTSVTDSKHSRTSLHYVGFAFDLRTRDTPIKILPLIKKDLQEALTDEFDVVLEKDHFHIEFQPKYQ
jgi:hypothetical protein